MFKYSVFYKRVSKRVLPNWYFNVRFYLGKHLPQRWMDLKNYYLN